MYNLTVEEAHTFFIGDGDWLVHNQDEINPIPPSLDITVSWFNYFIANQRFLGFRTVNGSSLLRYGSINPRSPSLSLPTGYQANHLNQSAAFPEINVRNGLTIGLSGDINLPSSQHRLFHKSLEDFWDQYRGTRELPTYGQYGDAVYNALIDAKVPLQDVALAAEFARQERLSYGLMDDMLIPAENIPDEIQSVRNRPGNSSNAGC